MIPIDQSPPEREKIYLGPANVFIPDTILVSMLYDSNA